jgi:predicted AlkP superfamily phosphohydrolase/phosphomutase
VKSFNEKIATNDKVEFIHYSLDRTTEAALKWAKKESFPWAHVLVDKHEESGLKKYAKKFVPYYMLVDKDGQILAEGHQAVFAMVDDL